jgi:hypothetical protein
VRNLTKELARLDDFALPFFIFASTAARMPFLDGKLKKMSREFRSTIMFRSFAQSVFSMLLARRA